jgi:hypothetical protein
MYNNAFGDDLYYVTLYLQNNYIGAKLKVSRSI